MGEIVYEENVVLSTLGEKTYKITSDEGEQTFQMWDFLTLLGPFVEFDTFNSNPKIRCVFTKPLYASDASWCVKETVSYGVGVYIHLLLIWKL